MKQAIQPLRYADLRENLLKVFLISMTFLEFLSTGYGKTLCCAYLPLFLKAKEPKHYCGYDISCGYNECSMHVVIMNIF